MITLAVNKFLGALTNLIAYSQVANTMERGQVGEFVGSFQDINVENGDGKVVLASDLLNVKDLSGTSSLLESNPPTVDEQYVSVENYKVIPMTINRYLMRGAFVDENQLANFIGYLISMMQATKTAYLSEELIKEIEAYTPKQQATQVVEINTINTTGLADPMQLEAANRYNANAIQKAFIKVLQAMSFPTNKYNDLQYKEVIDFSSIKLVIKAEQDVDIVVDSLAYLLNSDKITDEQRWSKTYVVPEEQFAGSTEYVAWLMHNKKIQYGYFYEVATSFFDGSTLNQNDWLHFAYYLATINAYPCVCFKINPSITPAALVGAN